MHASYEISTNIIQINHKSITILLIDYVYRQNICVGISLYKINWVILMNPNLPLTCIRNNVMCMKTPILLLYKNQHGI